MHRKERGRTPGSLSLFPSCLPWPHFFINFCLLPLVSSWERQIPFLAGSLASFPASCRTKLSLFTFSLSHQLLPSPPVRFFVFEENICSPSLPCFLLNMLMQCLVLKIQGQHLSCALGTITFLWPRLAQCPSLVSLLPSAYLNCSPYHTMLSDALNILFYPVVSCLRMRITFQSSLELTIQHNGTM